MKTEHVLTTLFVGDGDHPPGDDGSGERSAEEVDALLVLSGKCDTVSAELKTNLVDGIDLNGGVDQLFNEFGLQVLCTFFTISPNSKLGRWTRTSRKNFLAPTFKAFVRAASKSSS